MFWCSEYNSCYFDIWYILFISFYFHDMIVMNTMDHWIECLVNEKWRVFVLHAFCLNFNIWFHLINKCHDHQIVLVFGLMPWRWESEKENIHFDCIIIIIFRLFSESVAWTEKIIKNFKMLFRPKVEKKSRLHGILTVKLLTRSIIERMSVITTQEKYIRVSHLQLAMRK